MRLPEARVQNCQETPCNATDTKITSSAPASQARQLESLVRLAEARARCELSPTVTREHAEVSAAAITCNVIMY